MLKTIKISPNEALELQSLRAREMYQSAADLGYDHNEWDRCATSFRLYAMSLGIMDILEAQRVANTVWYNYDQIFHAAEMERDYIEIPYDRYSDCMERMDGYN